jgi:hypothetical protein
MRWREISSKAEVVEEMETVEKAAGTIKPIKPMDGDAWRRENERRQKKAQRIGDAKANFACKMHRLQSDRA